MKTKQFKLMLMATALFSIALIASCSDDESPTPADDRTALELTIDKSVTLHAIAVEGTGTDQYTTGSKATFLKAINAAEEIYDDAKATQGKVNSADQNLQRAIVAFLGKRVAPVEATDLLARWTFDEGTGISLVDVSGNGHDGVLTVGHPAAGGGGVPTWATDRHGASNKALKFTMGGHIVVPASTAFSPSELSISVWVKLTSMSEADCIKLGGRCRENAYMDNYLVSQNAWDGYKFQTQDDRYPFFTMRTSASAIADVAAKNNIPVAQWVHLMVTVKTGEMKFYLDGVNVTKTDGGEVLNGGFFALTDRYDFIIGAERPTAKVDPAINWVLSHFEGTMDDLRMYKKALAQNQVTTIYNSEKPAAN